MRLFLHLCLCIGLLGILATETRAESLAETDAPPPAETEVRIVAFSHDTTTELAPDEPVYLRLAYSSAEPIRLWVRAYSNGKPVTAALSNTAAPRSGRGETLGWFSLSTAGAHVDQVRVRIGGGQPYIERDLLTVPVSITLTDTPKTARPLPDWVEPLRAADADYAKNAPVTAIPSTFGDNVFLLLLIAGAAIGIPLGLFLPAWGMIRWRGLWRLACAPPLLALGFVVGRIVIETSRDPGSHNLWPFEIAYIALPSAAYIGGLLLLRYLLRKIAAPARPKSA